MYKIDVYMNEQLEEKTYCTTLKNGLEIFICKKPGFEKKIGMFGTKYGSIHNDFYDIITNKRVHVPNGIAHFLEHKLFEQEGANALDLFSKIGVSSNAYTSFDQTVFYFETINRFYESIDLLVKLVKTPYFTDENVNKEQGIIGQEIMMYDDDPNSVLYMNTMKGMYHVNPINIDIAGTIDSIAKITKELLYTCYYTFYSPQNMFFIVVGDVDVEETIQHIEKNIKLYEQNFEKEGKAQIQKYFEPEQPQIHQKEIQVNMDIYMPEICIGFKLDIVDGKNILRRNILATIISDMYFSKLSAFYEKEYNLGILTDPLLFDYEGGNYFSHVIIAGDSLKIDQLKEDIFNYLKEIKSQPIDEDLFELIKKKRIGNMIVAADNLNNSYRRIIESTLNQTAIYDDVSILENIKVEDLKEFLNLLREDNASISIVKPKECH